MTPQRRVAEYGWIRDGIVSLFSYTHIFAGYADPLVAW